MGGLDAAALGIEAAPGGERIRQIIDWLSRSAPAGLRAVRLDATAPGIRARELDRSGRRDLASLLRRGELAFAGVDAFVPPEHLTKPDSVDRAVSGILGAIDLAADLTSLAAGAVVTRSPLRTGTPASVSITIHEKTPPDVVRTIADHADGRGVRIADHAWGGAARESADPDATIGIGFDPAVALGMGVDPLALAARLGRRIACARLSDIGANGERVAPGSGRLDVGAYLITLATSGYAGSAILDLRALKNQSRAINEVANRATV